MEYVTHNYQSELFRNDEKQQYELTRPTAWNGKAAPVVIPFDQIGPPGESGMFKNVKADLSMAEEFVLMQAVRQAAAPVPDLRDELSGSRGEFSMGSEANYSIRPVPATANILFSLFNMLRYAGTLVFDRAAWDIVLRTAPANYAKHMSDFFNWNMEIYEKHLVEFAAANGIFITMCAADAGGELPAGLEAAPDWCRTVHCKDSASWPQSRYQNLGEGINGAFGGQRIMGGHANIRNMNHRTPFFAFITRRFFAEHDMLDLAEDRFGKPNPMAGLLKARISNNGGRTEFLVYKRTEKQDDGPREPMPEPPVFHVDGKRLSPHATGAPYGRKEFAAEIDFRTVLLLDRYRDWTAADDEMPASWRYDEQVLIDSTKITVTFPDGTVREMQPDETLVLEDGMRFDREFTEPADAAA